jgi:hypothetical protein
VVSKRAKPWWAHRNGTLNRITVVTIATLEFIDVLSKTWLKKS